MGYLDDMLGFAYRGNAHSGFLGGLGSMQNPMSGAAALDNYRAMINAQDTYEKDKKNRCQKHGGESLPRWSCPECSADREFKGQTYDAEFEEVKKDEWWFKEQPKALLK